MGQQHALIEAFEQGQMKSELPAFAVGDTIRVSTKIVEGEKERVQVFQGTVIARKGSGLSETFSLHRVSYGEGMERVFHIHSPRIIGIEVVKKGDVRRAKLYYLRGATGKAAKVQEKIGRKKRTQNGEKNASFATDQQNRATTNDTEINDTAHAQEPTGIAPKG